jgi:flagellar motor switch protein FliN/FliY
MSFSASPLVPGDQADDTDAWRQAAQVVLTAVTEAAAQIPSTEPLMPDAPLADPAAARLPEPAGTAVTGYLGAGADGKVLLVVGQELVTALGDTPFGALEPAQALRPALDTVAERLGGRLDGAPTAIAVEDCLSVLAGGQTVIVPLLAGDAVQALIGVTLATGGPAPAQQPAAAAGQGGAPAAAHPGAGGKAWGIDMLRDVEMEVTCELGRTRMSVRQLLALAPGDVVELDRLAGSPADLLVNGTLLARGEVVVVDESFGLRITEIVTRDAS